MLLTLLLGGLLVSLHAARCIEVLEPANLTRTPAATSDVLGKVHPGEQYLILGKFRHTLKIEYNGRGLWIERSATGKIPCPYFLEPPEDPNANKGRGLFLFIAIPLVTVLIAVGWGVYSVRSREKKDQQEVVILSGKNHMVTRVRDGEQVSIQSVIESEDLIAVDTESLEQFTRHLQYFIPDVILVDWFFSQTVQQDVERILSETPRSKPTLLIYYNVPPNSGAQQHSHLAHNMFLPAVFSDRDLTNMVSGFTTRQKQDYRQGIRRGVQTFGLQGELRDETLQSILQLVESGGKTGALVISDPNPIGSLYFENGMIVYAATRTAQGEEAVFAILKFGRGSFKFVLDAHAQTKNCMIPVIGVLMEFAQKRDEESREENPGPPSNH